MAPQNKAKAKQQFRFVCNDCSGHCKFKDTRPEAEALAAAHKALPENAGHKTRIIERDSA